MKRCADNRPKLTIFTPTYNRAYILPQLYRSLLAQSDQRFLWHIVDDGSFDGTKGLVAAWKKEEKINILYEYQENSGKPVAHNRAAAACNTELFTCVDSDDFLTRHAVSIILSEYGKMQQETGMVFMRRKRNGALISKWPKTLKHATLRAAYKRNGVSGDTMLVYRSDIIKTSQFPVFPKEKFVPEAYLYDRLDDLGELVFIHKAIYVCEYLEDGYTKSMRETIKNNPRGYLAYINQRLKKEEKLAEKIGDTVRYTSVSISCGKKGIVKGAVYPLIAAFTFPFGVCFYLAVYRGFVRGNRICCLHC